MLSLWFKLLLLALCSQLSASAYSQLFQNVVDGTSGVYPTANDSCVFKQGSHEKFILVCSDDDMCVIRSNYYGTSAGIPSCGSSGGASLPVTKKLNALYQLVRLSNETECGFSSVYSLVVRTSKLVNMGQLSRANCQDDVSRCPYQLKFLDLAYNQIDYLANNSFCQFRQLEHLGLGYCHLNSVDEEAFAELVNLREVDLHSNNLTHLPIGLFAANKKLQMVNLMDNKLRTNDLKAIVPISSLQYLDLKRNRISLSDDDVAFPPNLISLDISENDVQYFRSELINLKKLTYLHLQWNNISEIDKKAFQNMLEVATIDLSGNNIGQLHPDTFKNNLKLKTLFLPNNQLTEFPPIGHISALKNLIAKFNQISRVSKTDVIDCTGLKYIDLSNNRLSFIDKDAFSHTRQLTNLNLNDNRLSQSTADFKSSNISYLHLSFNNFTKFSFDFFSPTLISLFVSSNQIDTIEQFDYSDQNIEWNLTILDLSNNRIDTIADHSLDHLTELRSLDLNNNRLQLLPNQIFVKLTRLIELNLSNNRLKSITDGTFISITRLNVLLLDNNLLTQLPVAEMALLKSLTLVKLHDNPWSCACAFVGPFRAYLSDLNSPVYKSWELNCTENGSAIRLRDFNMDSCGSRDQLTTV